MKKVGTQLMVYIGILVLIVCGGIGLMGSMTAKQALVENTESILPDKANDGAKLVAEEIRGNLNIAATLAR